MGVPELTAVPSVSTIDSFPANPPKTCPPRMKTWAQAAGQKQSVIPLHRLPPEVSFPEDFLEPIRFDPIQKLLMYRGLMYHGSYMYLHGLSGDAAYLAALDQLYIASSVTRPARRFGGVQWIVGLIALAFFAAAWWRM